MKGQWMCMTPTEFLGRMRVSCARFTPKSFSVEDPAFSTAEQVTVMTYLTSRLSGRVQAPQPTNGNQGLHSGPASAFEAYNFSLEDAFSSILGSA